MRKRFTKGQLSRAIGSARAVPKVKLGAIVVMLDIIHGASHWYSWEIKQLATTIASMFNATTSELRTPDNRLAVAIEVNHIAVIIIAENSDAEWEVTLLEAH